MHVPFPLPDAPIPPDVQARVAAATDRLAEGLGIVLAPPAVVVTQPDQLDGQGQIPYASTDRTPAGPLQDLEDAVSRHLDLPRARLISRDGTVTAGGAACLFQVTDHEGAAIVEAHRWVVAASRNGHLVMRVRRRRTEDAARAAYEEALAWLAR